MTDKRVFGCLLTGGDRGRLLSGLRDIAVQDLRKWIEVAEANQDDVLLGVMRDALDRLDTP